MIGVVEGIIRDIEEHDRLHPDHGRGCACLDVHPRKLRALMVNLSPKSLDNLLTVIGYVYKRPR